MSWLKKINAICLIIVLISPVIYLTVTALNDDTNISSLIITTTEEEQEDKDSEEECDNSDSFLSQSIPSFNNLKQLKYNFYTKSYNLQNRSRDIFSPPPEIV